MIRPSAQQELPTEAVYFPPIDGRYSVKPGLLRFGADLGNGRQDQLVFQIDSGFERFHRAKAEARAEQLDKYCLTRDYDDAVAAAVAAFIVRRLVEEHPEHFQLRRESSRDVLTCHLTAQTLTFDAHMRLVDVVSDERVDPPYASALDALAMQAPEDLAVVCRSGTRHWLAAEHVCMPSYWSPGEKIGRSFVDIHAPVAGIEPINRRADSMVGAMINATAGLVRFTWGLSTDDRLNHHPEAPPGLDHGAWFGRRFDAREPRLFMRVERQTMWGFPRCPIQAALFTIRTSFLDLVTLPCGDERLRLMASAVASMSREALVYKGVGAYRDELLSWLEGRG